MNQNQAPETSSFNIHTFIHLAFCNASFFMEFTIFYIFPVYLYSLGASRLYIGVFNNINSICVVLYALFFSGFLSKTNQKKILLFSFLLHVVSMGIMYIFHDSLLLLFAAKILSSLTYVLGFSIFMLLAHELIPEKKRTSYIALFGISGIITNPAGAFIGEVLFEINHKTLFISAAFFSLLAFFLLLFLHYPGPSGQAESLQTAGPLNKKSKEVSRKDTMFKILLQKKMFLPVLITFIYFGCFAVFISFIPLLTNERLEKANMSLFFLSFSLISIFVRVTLIPYFDRIGKKMLIFIGFSSIILAFIGTHFIQNIMMLFLIGFFYGIGHSILFPVLSSLFVSMAGPDEKSSYNNLYLGSGFLGSITFSTLLGKIGDLTGTVPIFTIMIIVVLTLLLIIALFFRVKTC